MIPFEIVHKYCAFTFLSLVRTWHGQNCCDYVNIRTELKACCVLQRLITFNLSRSVDSIGVENLVNSVQFLEWSTYPIIDNRASCFNLLASRWRVAGHVSKEYRGVHCALASHWSSPLLRRNTVTTVSHSDCGWSDRFERHSGKRIRCELNIWK